MSVEKWFESKDTRGRRRKKRRGRNVIDREVQRGAKEVEARAKIGEQSKEEESIETKRERQLEGRRSETSTKTYDEKCRGRVRTKMRSYNKRRRRKKQKKPRTNDATSSFPSLPPNFHQIQLCRDPTEPRSVPTSSSSTRQIPSRLGSPPSAADPS